MIENRMGVESSKRKLESTSKGGGEKKRKLESGAAAKLEADGGPIFSVDRQEKREEEGEKGSMVMHTPPILSLPAEPDIFALLLSYMYKSDYTPSVDALPASASPFPPPKPYTFAHPATPTTVSATLSAANFIPPRSTPTSSPRSPARRS